MHIWRIRVAPREIQCGGEEEAEPLPPSQFDNVDARLKEVFPRTEKIPGIELVTLCCFSTYEATSEDGFNQVARQDMTKLIVSGESGVTLSGQNLIACQ